MDTYCQDHKRCGVFFMLYGYEVALSLRTFNQSACSTIQECVFLKRECCEDLRLASS